MPTNFLTVRGTAETLLTTELNSLANNSLAIGSAVTLTSAGMLWADLELVVSYGTAPTAGTAVLVWLLRDVNGSDYEDGGTSVQPLRLFDASFPLRNVTGAQRIIKRIKLPPGTIKALLKNDGTGQAMASSSNTLKIRPDTEQY